MDTVPITLLTSFLCSSLALRGGSCFLLEALCMFACETNPNSAWAVLPLETCSALAGGSAKMAFGSAGAGKRSTSPVDLSQGMN